VFQLPKVGGQGLGDQAQRHQGGKNIYDLEYADSDDYRVTIQGLSRTFDKEYWNYAILISGMLRQGMPVPHVVDVVANLNLYDATLNTWKNGMVRAFTLHPDGTRPADASAPNAAMRRPVLRGGLPEVQELRKLEVRVVGFGDKFLVQGTGYWVLSTGYVRRVGSTRYSVICTMWYSESTDIFIVSFPYYICPELLNPNTMTKAVFYHAGCPVCINAENRITEIVDRNKYDVEIVHLGEHKGRIAEAEAAGVKSVPALVLGHDVLHINHGASMAEVKG
jgi:glutaredoxin